MMGLYYPSVLSVSVYLEIFSYPPMYVCLSAASPCDNQAPMYAERCRERDNAVIEHEMLINY